MVAEMGVGWRIRGQGEMEERAVASLKHAMRGGGNGAR